MRGWATHVLCELPYPEAVGPLLLRLRDVDLSTRVSAAHALAAVSRLHPDEVRAGVLTLAHSVDPIDRAAAMRLMGELREAALVPELVRALADGDEAVVASAHASLVLVTRQDFGLDARPWLRWWELSSSRYRIEWLIDALTHEVSEIRRAAGEELRALSKEYFGYASDLPQRDRERAQQRYRDWWATEGRARFRRKGG
jgi:HEAT repeat protein